MNNPKVRTPGRVLSRTLIGAVLVAVLPLAGCGNNNDRPGGAETSSLPDEITLPQTKTLPTADSIGIDRDNPIAVMLGMCRIVFTRDANHESSYSDSYKRAEGLMTGKLAAELLKPVTVARPFPQWVQWQNEHAWIDGSCVVASDEHPADTKNEVSRVLVVTETVTGDAGDTTEEGSWAVHATAVRSGDTWKISMFSVSA